MNAPRAFPYRAARLGRACRQMAVLLAAMLTLTACATLLDPGPAPVRLQLSPSLPARLAAKPLNRQLVVSTPLAGRELDTDSIALVFNGREIRYLAGARWTSSVPFLVQRSLIEALEAAEVLRGVSNEGAGMAADVRLLTDIRQFSLHYASEGGVPTAVFDATFRLLGQSSGSILSTRNVEIRVPAAGKDNAALARAVETALSKALAEMVPWVAETVRGGR